MQPLYYIHLEITQFNRSLFSKQSFGNQSCKIRHTMAFFAFHIPAILLVTFKQALKSDWLLFFFSFLMFFCSLAEEKERFSLKNCAIRELIAFLKANQIPRIISDF